MPGVPRATERPWLRALRTAAAGVLLAGATTLSLAACGSKSRPVTVAAQPPTVDVYSSLPLQGASSTRAGAIVHGIELALAQARGRAGRWTVDYRSLDDSTPSAGGWDSSQTAANAELAASDPKAVYFIGDLDSGASEVSVPRLNRAGIAQVSPNSPYPGLTSADPGTAAGEPAKYYPAGVRTFMRLVPDDEVQAAAGLIAMQQAGCRTVAIANDGEADGRALANMVVLEHDLYGVAVSSDTVLPAGSTGADDFLAYAATIRAQDADCFYLAAAPSSAAVQVAEAVHGAVPGARLFAGSALCTSAFTSPDQGGIPSSVASQVECTLPTPDLAATPAGRAFLAAYRARFGTPDPFAVYGYEAMKLALSTIARLGRRGGQRAAVLRALLHTRGREAAFGRYGFRPDGETTTRSYSVYRIGPSGLPRFYETLTPILTVGSVGGGGG